jgi:hypothetical protein
MTLFRPVGEKELKLIANSGFTVFPPRLPEQPIFYPVTNQQYADEINNKWNEHGAVVMFNIDDRYISKFDKHVVGRHYHEEYWIPADELDEFNRNIIGRLQICE